MVHRFVASSLHRFIASSAFNRDVVCTPISMGLIAAISALDAGCFTSTQFLDQTAPVDYSTPLTTKATGTKCSFSLFGILPFTEYPLTQAKGQALKSVGRSALVDVEIETQWVYVVVGTYTCYTVRGRGANMIPTPGEARVEPETPILGESDSMLPSSVSQTPQPPRSQDASVLEAMQAFEQAGGVQVTLGTAAACRGGLATLNDFLGRPVFAITSDLEQVKGTLIRIDQYDLVVEYGGGATFSIPCLQTKAIAILDSVPPESLQ